METSERVQTELRLDIHLYNRLRANAKIHHQTFNKYVTEILTEYLDDEFPRLPPDFKVSQKILDMGKTLPHFTEKELAQDERLRYILSKGQQ